MAGQHLSSGGFDLAHTLQGVHKQWHLTNAAVIAAAAAVPPGDVGNDIEIFRSSNTGAATLTDAQGNKAQVVGNPTVYGKMVFWDVSNVLLSSECLVLEM